MVCGDISYTTLPATNRALQPLEMNDSVEESRLDMCFVFYCLKTICWSRDIAVMSQHLELFIVDCIEREHNLAEIQELGIKDVWC